MNKYIYRALICLSFFMFSACEKDDVGDPKISFKSGASYTSSDVTLPAGTNINIGITANRGDKKVALKKFNINKYVAGGSNASIYEENLSGGDEDNFEYDFATTVDSIQGQASKYTFTITNRDGIRANVSLIVTTL